MRRSKKEMTETSLSSVKPLVSNELLSRTDSENDSSETSGQPGQVTRFSQPYNSQSASRLMQLPAELYLKVLRLVLRHPGYLKPLPIEQSHGSCCVADTVPIVELSAQLLATCQSVYKQAWPVLYGDNTLRVICQSVSPHYHSCYVLGAGIELHCSADDMPAEGYDLLSLARRCANDDWLTRRFAKHYGGLSKIQNIELSVGHSLTEEIFIACRAVWELVQRKNVMLKLLPKNTGFNLEDARDLDAFQCSEAYRLKACRIFRCRSIRFDGNKSDVSALIREIEANTHPPRDIFPMWKQANNYVKEMPRIDNTDIELAPYLPDASFSDHGDKARAAVQAYDSQDASEHIVIFLNQASKWTKAWAERAARRGEERYQIQLAKKAAE